MESSIKPVSLKDNIPFRCRRCSACCRDLEDQLMLEPPDAYRLGQHLRKSGEMVEIEDVYAKYTHAAVLVEGVPIFLMNTVGPNHACIFLKGNRCTIYSARPRVCRLYPFSVYPKRPEEFQYLQCLDGHTAHCSGGTVCTQDWFRQNLSEKDRTFLQKEAGYLAEMGQILHSAGPERQREWLFSILFYRYYNYDLERPFLEQYQRNHQELLNRLRQNERKEQ